MPLCRPNFAASADAHLLLLAAQEALPQECSGQAIDDWMNSISAGGHQTDQIAQWGHLAAKLKPEQKEEARVPTIVLCRGTAVSAHTPLHFLWWGIRPLPHI